MTLIRTANPSFLAVILFSFVLAIFVVAVIIRFTSKSGSILFRKPDFYKTAVACILTLSVILLVRTQAADSTDASRARLVIHNLKEPRLNKRDQRVRQIGYYQPLLDRQRIASQMLEEPIQPADDTTFQSDSYVIRLKDLRVKAFRPSIQFRYKGAHFVTNSYGLRDREYTITKPHFVYRMAFLGTSLELGTGVDNPKVFEAVLEEKLNRLQGKSRKFEIINFSIMGQSPIESMKKNEVDVSKFSPDATFIFLHDNDDVHLVENLRWAVNSNIDPEKPFLKEAIRMSGVRKDMEVEDFARHLQPYVEKIFEGVLTQIAADTRKYGAIPVCVWMPPGRSGDFERRKEVLERNGFVFINLRELYDFDDDALVLAAWDNHLNNDGHQLIADVLYQKLLENNHRLRMKLQ